MKREDLSVGYRRLVIVVLQFVWRQTHVAGQWSPGGYSKVTPMGPLINR